VPMSLFRQNRDKLIARFEQGEPLPEHGLIFLAGGVQETRHETDHEPLFRLAIVLRSIVLHV